MRIAKCIRPLTLNVVGNLTSVAIGEGWQGDLDQVVSRTDRGSHTLATELGDHLNDTNFEFIRPASKHAPAKAPAAKAPQQE